MVRLLSGVGLLLLVVAVGAAPAAAEALPGQACGAAGGEAEQVAALPANMLVSIGVVESGRADPATGQVAPWPWTVNVDGAGRYFSTKQDAIDYVRLAQSSGAQDVDVGCFQVSLKYHADAFASLDEAFDPAANARYAAGYLVQLKGQTGSWNSAIADYHSAEPDLGLPYQRRVLAAWHGLGAMPAGLAAMDIAVMDPGVILQAPAARLVRVITLSSGGTGSGSGAGWPRVITP